MFTVWVRMGTKHNAVTVSMAGKSWSILLKNLNQYVLDLRLQERREDLILEVSVLRLLALTTSQFLAPNYNPAALEGDFGSS